MDNTDFYKSMMIRYMLISFLDCNFFMISMYDDVIIHALMQIKFVFFNILALNYTISTLNSFYNIIRILILAYLLISITCIISK